MPTNNQVILTGNIDKEPRIYDKDGKLFAAFSIATKDTYKDKNDEWRDKGTVWHNVLVFKPDVVEMAKEFKKGARLEVTGSISYREFSQKVKGGKAVKKREASIIAYKIEPKPLAKKGEPAEP